MLAAVVIAGAMSGPALVAQPAAADEQPTTRVNVIAIPALSWADLSPTQTPNLWRFAQSAARGVLAVKSAGRLATCGAAMTTLGAGNRAVATRVVEAQCDAPGAAHPELWPGLIRANRDQLFGTQPGALADVLSQHGSGTDAHGA